MKGTTHLAAGLLTGLFITSQQPQLSEATIVFTAGSIIGSILPDIDNRTSKIGQHIGITSFLIQLFIGHRTIFHAPVLYVLLYALITAMFPGSSRLLSGISVGVTTHLFLDMLNPAGIPLLWPLPLRIHLSRIRSGGLIDKLIGAGLWTYIPIYIFQAVF